MYIYVSYLYINLSLESLDKTKAKYKKKVEDNRKLLIKVIARK